MATMADQGLMMFVFVLALSTVQVRGWFMSTNFTLLESAVAKGAVCLDGSPPVYFHDSGSGSGANNWIVYLMGGGWCKNDQQCRDRMVNGGIAGSSKGLTAIQFFGVQTNEATINPDFYNWNRVVVNYCDGGSFLGDVEEVDPVANIFRRGARIFQAVVEDLLQKGMKDAENAVLMGNSAGGLATMLQCDSFRRIVPRQVNVKCVADSGFFIRGKDLAAPEKREGMFADIVKYHNMGKNLHTACTSKMDASLCLFPENFVEYIKTPLLLVNSAFDLFQLDTFINPVEPGWKDCEYTINNVTQPCTLPQAQAIKDFQTTLLQALPKANCPMRGVWITNCFNHDHMDNDFKWTDIKVNDKNVQQVVGDWILNRGCPFDIESGDWPRYCIKRWKP